MPFPVPPPQCTDAPASDVVEYVIEARLAADHRTVDGTERIRWTNTSSRPATEIWWHLYMNAFANDRTLFMRTGGREGHRGHEPGAHGHSTVLSMDTASGEDLLARADRVGSVADDETELRTPLATAVPPGESIELRVAFRTVLPDAFARTGTWDHFVFVAQWFPKLAVLERDGSWAHFPFHANSEFYADFGRYDVTLEVPHGDVVGAVGDEIGTVVSAGGADRHHFVADRVHDFAWTAWREFRTRDARIAGIRTRVLFPPGLDDVAARDLDALAWAIPYFRGHYGEPPYPSLTIVVAPRQAAGVGGMEYPGLITTEGEWFEPSWERNIEWVTVHEFAHQYFYAMLANNEWQWPFLDEGLADDATGRAMTAHYGDGREMLDAFGWQFGYWAFEGGFAAEIDDAIPVASRSDRFPDGRSYADHVYRRTAAILRSIERTFGPASFDRAMSLYVSRCRFRHPSPGDLIQAFRDVGAIDASDVLASALFGDARLDDAVARVDAGSVRITHSGEISIPTVVEAHTSSGVARAQVPRERSWWTWTMRPGERALSAHIDPRHDVPLDDNRLDDAAGEPAGTRGWFGLAGRVAFWIDALFRWLGP